MVRNNIGGAVILFALFAQIALSAVVRSEGGACSEAYEACDFTFLDTTGLTAFPIDGPPDIAFTPRILSRVPGEVIGVVNTNNMIPEFIQDDGRVEPITSFGSPNLNPAHFKAFSNPTNGGSCIGHDTYSGNQVEVAKGQCIRIFFHSYQLIESIGGFVLGTRNDVPREENKCIVFRAEA